MMNNKKGVSAVVATVLIILITVAAVTIIWAAIIPMIKDQIQGGTTCLDAVSQVGLVTQGGYTCVVNDSVNDGNIQLQVSHGAKDFGLHGVQVLVSIAGNTYSYDYVTTADLPGTNEEKVITIDPDAITGLGATKVLDATGTIKIEKIEIAPMVTVGNTYETCEVCATVTSFSKCKVP